MSITIKSDDIRKAFIKPNGELKVSLVVPTDDSGRIINDKQNIDRKVLPHADLKKSFRNLLPHAINFLRLVPKGKVYDEKYIKNHEVHNDTDIRDYELVGFERKGADDDPEVILTVRKKCIDDKFVDIKTKPVKTHGKTTYQFSAFLNSQLDVCIEECYQYIAESKYYDSDQLEIDHESEDDDNPF